jgi:hypothetical protein
MHPSIHPSIRPSIHPSVRPSIHPSIYGSTALVGVGRFFSFGRTPWTGEQPVLRPLPTHRITQAQNKRKQISMPTMGFELTIPVFERTKIVHALDRAATEIGSWEIGCGNNS